MWMGDISGGYHRHDVEVTLINTALEFISVTGEDLRNALKLKDIVVLSRKLLK